MRLDKKINLLDAVTSCQDGSVVDDSAGAVEGVVETIPGMDDGGTGGVLINGHQASPGDPRIAVGEGWEEGTRLNQTKLAESPFRDLGRNFELWNFQIFFI